MRQGHQQEVPYTDLLLLGGGHAHVQLLKMLAMEPVKHLRMTLISDVIFAPYSGMLPGYLAGFYDYHEVHFDLPKICAKAGARFIHASAKLIDPVRQSVTVDSGIAVDYDVLSVNIGCAPQLPSTMDQELVLPMKPISGFLQKWDKLCQSIDGAPSTPTVAVVGGGAAGYEIALLIQHRLGSRPSSSTSVGQRQGSVHLLQASSSLLPNQPPRLQRVLGAKAAEAGVSVHLETRVTSYRDKTLVSESGLTLPCDYAVWATQAAAPALFRVSGLAIDAAGFMSVNDSLQSVSHENIFGAGDCIAFPKPLPKSGVFAVRQASTLNRNLRRILSGQSLLAYKPQTKQLSLITAGERLAYAARGGYFGGGRLYWHLKDRIDRKFMRTWQDYGALEAKPLDSTEHQPNTCGGCGSKVDPATLRQVLDEVMRDGEKEDAVVFRPVAGQRVVESVDMFRTFISDHFLFGKIGALHALSDLYAMGAKPVSVQALLQLIDMPTKMVQRDMRLILKGVNAALAADGVALRGGHTTVGVDTQLGFAVMGTIDAENPVLSKTGAKPGDRMILTKPLGTGACLAAHMHGALRGDHLEEVLQSMEVSNRVVLDLSKRFALRAVTDVTGFGLAGHLVEMLGKQGLSFHPEGVLPIFSGFPSACAAGFHGTLADRIRKHVVTEAGVSAAELPDAWFDPQTNGGLLIAVPPDLESAVLDALHESDFAAATCIGTVTDRASDAEMFG